MRPAKPSSGCWFIDCAGLSRLDYTKIKLQMMLKLFLVIIVHLVVVHAYSSLLKRPPARADIYVDEKTAEKTADKDKRVALIQLRNQFDLTAMEKIMAPRPQEIPVREDASPKVKRMHRRKRQWHFHSHSGEHLGHHIVDPHYGLVHADVHYHPDPMQQHSHYRVNDPYSPWGGHYHTTVHNHYDPWSGQLYPAAHTHYHDHDHGHWGHRK